jgi:hypothetical protein
MNTSTEDEEVWSRVDAPAEFAGISDLWSDPPIIEARRKLHNDFYFALLAFDLPNELVLGPERAPLAFLRDNWHEVGQDNFAASSSECRFENIRVLYVPPAYF